MIVKCIILICCLIVLTCMYNLHYFKKIKQKRDRQRGYNYAKKVIANNKMSKLMYDINEAYEFGTNNDFDIGCEQAIIDKIGAKYETI